jgi:preprotein translocase subunit SecY
MGRGRFFAALDSMRGIPERWRKTGFVLAGLLLCEIGARIAAPGLVGRVLGDNFRRSGRGGLLWLYDRLVGGALSRGAVLALGILPYISARIFVRIARAVIPAVGEMWTHDAGRTSLKRWTRALTVGLALVQSYGFARFALSIPGAVANPGAGFVAQTMLVLTGGAIVAMGLGEQITALNDADDTAGDENEQVRDTDQPVGVPAFAQHDRGELLLHPAPYGATESYASPRDAVGIPIEPRDRTA